MIKSKLPNNVLGKIWKLSDVDKDGEFMKAVIFAVLSTVFSDPYTGRGKTEQ